MAFRCPGCHNPRSLSIARQIELPPDARSDEVALQVLRCGMCGFAGIAVYEESRRGVLGDDHFSQVGYRVQSAAVEAIERALARCPTPGNARCRCAAHVTYGRRDTHGRWAGLDPIDLGAPFAMAR